ncbi:hypothetical protein [Nocardia asteroides]|uniref:hypothetical protein n=1 Tax=Nocardia asteroides TaxID=1824 RepID=UPI00340E0535
MRADAPLPSVEYADEPVSQWILDAPLPSVEEIPGVPDGVVIPDGVVANFTGGGLALAAVVAKPGLYPEFTSRGTLSAVIRIKVAVTAAFSGGGQVDLPGSHPARFGGSGALAAVAYPGRVLGAGFTGSGQLSAPVIPVGTTGADFTGSGTVVGAIAVPVAAAFTSGGTLTAGVLGGIPVAAALTGAGVLSAATSYRYAVTAAFTGAGAFDAPLQTRSVTASFTGGGTLAASVTPGFQPSGMTKNGTVAWAGSATWVTITSWTANTGTYPGSTVDGSHRLVVQGTKTGATISGQAAYTGGGFGRTHSIRLVDQSGAVIATGSPNTATSGNCTVTATGVNLAGITAVELQMSGDFSAGTMSAGAGTFVTIT